MADKTADAIKLNLRLPKALHKRLTRQARRNNVSLNTEIVNQLEGSAAAEIKKVIEATRPYHEEALKAATAGATAGTMALLANFFRGFIAAGEGQPLSEQDLRLRHRMIKGLDAWPDPDTAGTMALGKLFRGFPLSEQETMAVIKLFRGLAAGEGQPLSEQDLRLRHRMINAWPDPDGVLQRAGREMRSAQDEAVRPAKESEQK